MDLFSFGNALCHKCCGHLASRSRSSPSTSLPLHSSARAGGAPPYDCFYIDRTPALLLHILAVFHGVTTTLSALLTTCRTDGCRTTIADSHRHVRLFGLQLPVPALRLLINRISTLLCVSDSCRPRCVWFRRHLKQQTIVTCDNANICTIAPLGCSLEVSLFDRAASLLRGDVGYDNPESMQPNRVDIAHWL